MVCRVWDEVADAFGEVLGASGYAVLVVHGGLWADGLAATTDVQDEMLEVDVPALQGADCADARSVAEHGDVDRVGVSDGHVVVDGLDLVHGGGHGLDLAFLSGCGDHAGIGWDEGAFAVPAGRAGGGEHGFEDLERVDAHGALGVVQLVVPPTVPNRFATTSSMCGTCVVMCGRGVVWGHVGEHRPVPKPRRAWFRLRSPVGRDRRPRWCMVADGRWLPHLLPLQLCHYSACHGVLCVSRFPCFCRREVLESLVFQRKRPVIADRPCVWWWS